MSAAGFGAKTPLLGYDVAVVCRGLQEEEPGLASMIYLQPEESDPVDATLLGLHPVFVTLCFWRTGVLG